MGWRNRKDARKKRKRSEGEGDGGGKEGRKTLIGKIGKT